MVQEEQKVDSLFDFLYVDKEKVAYLYSQLFPEGLMIGYDVSSSEDDKQTNTIGLSKIVKAGVDVTQTSTQSQTHRFDTQWSAAIVLLDKLSESNRLKKSDITEATLGDLVLIEGSLQILDFDLIKKGLVPFLDTAENIISRQSNTAKKNFKKEADMIKGMMKFISCVENAVNINLLTNNETVWASSKREYFNISPQSICLEHGSSITGKWNLLAILNEAPDNDFQSIKDSVSNIKGNKLTDIFNKISDGFREFTGRGENCYGVTPILLFRELN